MPQIENSLHDKKSTIALLTCVILSFELLDPAVSYLIFVFLILFTKYNVLNNFRDCISIIWPLVACIIFGVIISLSEAALTFNSVKGFYYESRPVLIFVIAYAMGRYIVDLRSIFVVFYLSSIILSVVYILNYYLTGDAAYMTRFDLRSVVGAGYLTVGIGISLGIFELLRGRFSRLSVVTVLLGAVCVGLSDSRTAMLIIIIYTIIFYLPALMNPLAAVLTTAIIFIVTTPAITLFVDEGTLVSLIYEFPSSLSELIAVMRYTDFEIHTGWRGYETYQAFEFMRDQNIFNRIFGTGLHTEVPLGFYIILGGDDMNSIPIFHNGFSFVFVRAGYLGILLYIYQMYLFSKAATGYGLTRLNDSRYFKYFIFAGVFSLIIITPLIGGVYSTSGSSILFLIAFFIGSMRARSRERALPSDQFHTPELQRVRPAG